MTNASNTTTHYGLSQWAADDLVRREDFNTDHAAIDAALHSLDTDISALEAADTAITTAYQAAVNAHAARTDNPHSVTAAQAGAAAAVHSHAASGITYDGTTSGLAADDVQSAVDEIKASVGNYREIVFGTYIGNSSSGQTINLGFTPSCVIVSIAMPSSSAYPSSQVYSSLVGNFSAIAYTGHPAFGQYDGNGITYKTLEIVENGFAVGSAMQDSYTFIHINHSYWQYNYIAFK